MDQSASNNENTKRPPFAWRRLGSDFGYACVINVICAAVLTFILGNGNHFISNLIGSMCIGSIAFLCIDLPRLAFWGEHRRPTLLPFIALIALAAAVAQVAGQALFGWIMDIRIPGPGDYASSRMVGAVAFTMTAASAGALFFSSRERIARLQASAAQEKARAESIQRQAMQAQLQLLQAQIEPHMLFNTLANLQGLIGIDPERAQILLDQLIQYLRATLSSSRAASTTLGQEFTLMEAYLGLMAVRMGARLRFQLDLPEVLRSVSLPPMLLQPLVENAIQHGLEPNIEGGTINVSAALDGGTLVLTVSDDGLGLAQPQARHGTGLGLSNIAARLQALYGDSASFSLTAREPAGALARLTVPLPG